MTTNSKIERIKNPKPEFLKKYLTTLRRPVIMTNIVNNWQASSLWTDEYIYRTIGD